MAMMEIVYGINMIYTNATPLGGYVSSYTGIASGRFLGISYLIWIALLVAVITWFIFNMTRHGKYMYAIGGNLQAAEVAGIPVKKTLIIIYAKAAAMYGLAGFMLGAKLWRFQSSLVMVMRWRLSQLVPSAAYPFPEAVVKFHPLSSV